MLKSSNGVFLVKEGSCSDGDSGACAEKIGDPLSMDDVLGSEFFTVVRKQ